MQARDHRPAQHSTGWTVFRRDALLRAEVALREAGRAAELIPDDPEAARLAEWSFRWASRARQSRMGRAA